MERRTITIPPKGPEEGRVWALTRTRVALLVRQILRRQLQLLLLRDLHQPRQRPDAGLVVDGGQQRRQGLEQVVDGSTGVGCGAFALRACVPDADLGLQPVDGLRVGFGELLVRPTLDHQVAHETFWAAEDIGELAVGGRHLGDSLGLLLLGVERSFSLFRPSVVCCGMLVHTL
jgi:hypothetical protein